MYAQVEKPIENESRAAPNRVSQKSGEIAVQFLDTRPESIAQRKVQEMANKSPHVRQLRAIQELADNSPRVMQCKAIQAMANDSPQVRQAAQWQALADNYTSQRQRPIQKKENNTGLPGNLKAGIEHLSGYSLDDVKVHYDSDKPAQFQAHAYAQGTDIHVASGQEKHLPHEAWHVVQQKQGRVKPTLQMKGGLNVNDNEGLEKEADLIGAKEPSPLLDSFDEEDYGAISPDMSFEKSNRLLEIGMSNNSSPAAPIAHARAATDNHAVNQPSIEANAEENAFAISLENDVAQSSGIIQLTKNHPGGNPRGRGGKGKKIKVGDQRKHDPKAPPIQGPPQTRNESERFNPLAALLNIGEFHIQAPEESEPSPEVGREGSSPMTYHKFFHGINAAGKYLNDPKNAVTKEYLGSLIEPLIDLGIPKRTTVKEITPQTEEHGYYDPNLQEITIGILTPEAAQQFYRLGLGTREENLAETGVHEFTHILDLVMAIDKDYRLDALQNLEDALPKLGVTDVEYSEADIDRYQEVGGLLDPHIGLTMVQGFFRKGSQVPLLSELMANFAEISSAPDPIGHLMNRPGMLQKDNETDEAYYQRISNDYDLLMTESILPYSIGLANDEEMPEGVRTFFKNALLTMPTSGAGFVEAIKQRREQFVTKNKAQLIYAALSSSSQEYLTQISDRKARTKAEKRAKLKAKKKAEKKVEKELRAPKLAALKEKLRIKIRAMQDERRKKR